MFEKEEKDIYEIEREKGDLVFIITALIIIGFFAGLIILPKLDFSLFASKQTKSCKQNCQDVYIEHHSDKYSDFLDDADFMNRVELSYKKCLESCRGKS